MTTSSSTARRAGNASSSQGGGSGHGFKFGGSIGAVVADCVEELDNSLGERFRIGDRLDAPRAEASRGFALSDPATG